MKTTMNKTIFAVLCFVLALCDHGVTSSNIVVTCQLVSSDKPESLATHTTNETHLGKIKDSCPQNFTGNTAITLEGTLKTLEENVFTDISNVLGIRISNVGLEEIRPGTFKDLSLSVLYLDQNSLRQVKTRSFQNVSITGLNMNNNKISSIEPGSFATLHAKDKSGIQIGLFNNELKEVDPQVFNNKDIHALGLVNNSISELRPGDFSNLPNLDYLLLAGNELKEVPNGIFNGSKIKTLDLAYNKISFVASDAFKDMKSLSHIKLHTNQLSEWDNQWFRGLSKMIIVASFNNFESIGAGAFSYVPNGSEILIHHNRIRNISDKAFDGVTRLERIDLRYNEIEEWSENILKNVFVNNYIYLSHNRISCSRIATRVFTPASHGKRILCDNF